MRTAALGAVLVVVAVAGLAPRTEAFVRPRGVRLVRRSPVMLVEPSGRDAFADIQRSASPLSKFFKSVPAPVASTVLNVLVPAAGVAGFVIPFAPTQQIAAGIAGSYLLSILGAEGRRRLVLPREQAALVEVAALLEDDFTKVSAEDVRRVVAKYGVPEKETGFMLAEIYKRFILSMLRNPEFKTSELKELLALHETLALTPEQLGNAFFDAFVQVYRDNVKWASTAALEDPESIERMTIDKCVYLASRVLSTQDTEEGYSYTMARCRQLLQLSQADFEKRCLSLARPLYEKALAKVSQKLESLTFDQLAMARTSLGLAEQEVKELHVELYRSELRTLLSDHGEGKERIDEADAARLDKLSEVLGLGEEERRYLDSELTVPLLEAASDEAVVLHVDGELTADEAIARFTGKREALRIAGEAAFSVLLESLKLVVDDPLDQAVEFLQLGNRRGASGALRAVLHARDAVGALALALVQAGELPEASLEDTVLTVLRGAGAGLPEELGLELYEVILADLLQRGDGAEQGEEEKGEEEEEEDEETTRLLADMRVVLGVDETAAVATSDKVVGPLFRAQLEEVVGRGEFSAADGEAMREAVQRLGIPVEVRKTIMRDLYAKRLAELVVGGRIYSAEEKAGLQKMANFLALEAEEVTAAHEEKCAGIYQRAVLEAMGSTGVIAKDYLEGLDKLADRLMIAGEKKEKVFDEALKEKLRPIVARLVSEFERSVLSKQQYAAKTGKDQGDDVYAEAGGNLGLEAGANMMLEVVNLVDFFEGNGLWSEAPMDSKDEEAEAVEGETEGAGSSQGRRKGKAFSYRVTAAGMAEPKVLEGVYRQFVVNTLQAKNAPGQQQQRYALAGVHIAGILGITPDQQAEIREDIGKLVYSQYVNNMLRSKGAIEPSDFQLLVNVQSSLELDDEYCVRLLFDLKKQHLAKILDSVRREPEPTGEQVESLVQAAEKLGLDLVDDVRVEERDRVRYFLAQAAGAIASHKVTEENKEELEKFQESWAIPPDVANSEFAQLVESTCSASAAEAEKSLQSSNNRQAVASIDRLVSFAQFLPVSVDIEPRMKERMVKVYMAAKSDFEGNMDEADQRRVEVLKSVLALETSGSTA